MAKKAKRIMAEQNDSPAPEKKNDKKFFIVIILLFLGLAAVYWLSLGAMDKGLDADGEPAEMTENAPASESIDETAAPAMFEFDIDFAKRERVLGDKSAPIKITEHSSFTCGHCGTFHKTTFDEFKSKYIDTGKAYLVFSDFPLNAPALHATLIGRCIADDDQYFAYVDELFKDQDNWAFDAGYLKKLEEKAAKYGLDQDAVAKCLNSDELQAAILKRMQAVQQQYGVQSTPSFVVNNQDVISGALPYADFDKAIQAAINPSEESPADAENPAEQLGEPSGGEPVNEAQ